MKTTPGHQTSTLRYRIMQEKWLLVAAFGIVLVVYAPTIGAGFVMDFIGWQERYEAGSFYDILHCFGYPGLHQVQHLFFYSMYQLFGIHGLPWYLVFAFLHALNGYLVYVFIRDATHHMAPETPKWLAGVGALLFLLCPYQAEVVVWKVCIHYLLVCAILLISLLCVQNDLKYGDSTSKYRIATFLLFAGGLFILELVFVFPFILFAYLLVARLYDRKIGFLKRDLLRFVLPMLFLLAIYLILNRAVLGSWVGHYGADTHLQSDILAMSGAGVKYAVKYLLLFRFMPYTLQHSVYGVLSIPMTGFLILLALLSMYVIAAITWKTLKGWQLLGLFGMTGFIFSILPVSNLYFYYLQFSENDRYGYLASFFLFWSALIVLSRLSHRLTRVLSGVYLFIAITACTGMALAWRASTDIYQSLVEDFAWYEESPVYLLNVPDNYRGIFMYRVIGQPSGFSETLRYHRKKPYTGAMYDVLQYNMRSPGDHVHVTQIAENTLKVEFAQWGNWWWRNGIGAGPYSNEKYSVTPRGQYYEVTFNRMDPGAVYLYQAGGKWHQFKPGGMSGDQ